MTVDERLSKLEHSCRRWRCAAVGSILVVVVIAAAGADKPLQIPDVVRVRAFHVVGKDDKVLVKLEDTSGAVYGVAGTITTFHAPGNKLVWITATEGAATARSSRATPGATKSSRSQGPRAAMAWSPRSTARARTSSGLRRPRTEWEWWASSIHQAGGGEDCC